MIKIENLRIEKRGVTEYATLGFGLKHISSKNITYEIIDAR